MYEYIRCYFSNNNLLISTKLLKKMDGYILIIRKDSNSRLSRGFFTNERYLMANSLGQTLLKVTNLLKEDRQEQEPINVYEKLSHFFIEFKTIYSQVIILRGIGLESK